MRTLITICIGLLITGKLFAQAGPYAPPVGQIGTDAIHKDSSLIVSWATNAIIERGWQNLADTSLGKTNVGNDTSATDKSGVNGIVSLGDNGSATLTFSGSIYDGIGADFAVFENSFDGLFLELAFVEVSSDGINFFRFDAVSLTDTTMQTGSFGNTDATEIYNLAGKYQAQYGTPFDLNELAGIPGLDINLVTHIRIIDVVGNITPPFASYDSQSGVINDPWPTPFPSGGFDLDAVGVINFTPTTIEELSDEIQLTLYPNPALNFVHFSFKEKKDYSYQLTGLNGAIISQGLVNKVMDISMLNPGVYFIHICSEDKSIVKKIIKN